MFCFTTHTDEARRELTLAPARALSQLERIAADLDEQADHRIGQPRRLASAAIDIPPGARVDFYHVDQAEGVVVIVFESDAFELVQPGQVIPRITPEEPTADEIRKQLADEFRKTITGGVTQLAGVATIKARSIVREYAIAGVVAAASAMLGDNLYQLARALYARFIGN